jgi:hypothetical protein
MMEVPEVPRMAEALVASVAAGELLVGRVLQERRAKEPRKESVQAQQKKWSTCVRADRRVPA